MFKMFEGEKTGTFWAGLIVLSLASLFLLGIVFLISVEPPQTLPILWDFWITPPPTKFLLLTAPIIGCVVFVLVGWYMMRVGVKTKELKPAGAAPPPPPPPPLVTAANLPLEIADVKGIGSKREGQLKAIGISTVEDLAKASAEELAEEMKTTPEIAGRWIKEAKKLLDWWKLLCSYIYESMKKSE